MGKERVRIKLTFERGRMNNGDLVETKLFRLGRKREKKLRPKHTKMDRRTNQGKDCYELSVGREYRCVTTLIKSGKQLCCDCTLDIGKHGRVTIKKWRGNFPPQFSLL